MGNFLLSFFILFAVIMVSFLLRGALPFGDECLLSIDAWSQYYPMLCTMKEAVKTGQLQYSFNGALGFNLWTQSAYYTNSILWVVLYILPDSCMISGVNILTAVRIGLAGLTFCYYLNSHYEKKRRVRISVVVFSCAYALSAYFLAFINQFMWHDAVIMLPVVLAGLEKICRCCNTKKDAVVYIIALAYTIWSNYYIGFMVCLFVGVYYVGMQLATSAGLKERMGSFGRFAVYSLTAAAIDGVVLLPSYIALSKTAASEQVFTGKIELYHSLGEMLGRLLPFSGVALAYEAPNLYCGLTCVFLCVWGFFTVRKTVKERLCYIGACLFFYFSLNTNLLDFIWHGFHYPNQLPARYSFCLIFLIVKETFGAYESCRVKYRNRGYLRILSWGILALLMCELMSNAIYTIVSHVRMVDADSYYRNYNEIKSVAASVEDDGFYRIELEKAYNFNQGQLCNYRGISYYSSTMSKEAYDFFVEIGMPVYAKNVSTRYVPRPGADALFGVKYLIRSDEDKYTIIENGCYLPPAFSVKEGAGEEFVRIMLDENTGKAEVANLIDEYVTGYLNIEEYTGEYIKGEIVSEGGILITTLPDDVGWSIYIDGSKQETLRIAGYLCAASLEAGKHHVKLVYETPGIRAGAILSMMGIAALLILFLLNKTVQPRYSQRL